MDFIVWVNNDRFFVFQSLRDSCFTYTATYVLHTPFPAFQEGIYREILCLPRNLWANSPYIDIISRTATKLTCANFSNRNKYLLILLHFALSLFSCQVINCYFLECLWTGLVLVTLCFPFTVFFFFFHSFFICPLHCTRSSFGIGHRKFNRRIFFQ